MNGEWRLPNLQSLSREFRGQLWSWLNRSDHLLSTYSMILALDTLPHFSRRIGLPYLPRWTWLLGYWLSYCRQDVSSGVDCLRRWTSNFTSLAPKGLLSETIITRIQGGNTVPLVCARHSYRCFMYRSWNSLASYEEVVIIIFILQKRNRLREVR